MTRQFSLAHLTALGCNPAELTYIAARAGYNFVSIRPIGLGTTGEPQYPLAEDKTMFRQTKAALNETGIKLLDIEMVRIVEGVNPSVFLPAFEVAAELGGRHVLTTVQTDNRNFAIENFSELCELAKPFGLTIDLEFITWYNVSTLKDAADIVGAANCENGGILLDTLHFNRSKAKLEELDVIPPNWFHYAHACNASKEIPTTKEGLIHTAREERLLLGEGDIDVAAIINRIPEIPYSLEIPHDQRAKELGYEEYAKRCLQTAKEYFELHPRDMTKKQSNISI